MYHKKTMGEIKDLVEDDFVWNAVGKKLIVDKVTKDEYFLVGFGQPSASPFSKAKVNNYIKTGQWTLKPKMAKGGKMRDNNLANNYPPYDKITKGDVIAGRLGKDQMGGKNKMAKGGNAEKEYVVTLQNSDSGELMKINVMGTSEDNAVDNAYMEAGVNKDYEVYSVKKMAKGGAVSKREKEKLSNIAYTLRNASDSWISKNHGKFVEMQNEYKKQFKKVYGHTNYADPNDMAKGGGVNSSDELYILKVYDLNNNLLDKSKRVWARNISKAKQEAIDMFEDEMKKKYGTDLRFKVEEAPSMMAKGGKTKKGKQDPPVIRGYVDDEPYEYGDGGTMNCWCYDIGGL